LGITVMGIAVASAATVLPSQLAAAPADDAIRPFHFDVPEEQLVDLGRRIAATRWPDRETVVDESPRRAALDGSGSRALLGDRLRLYYNQVDKGGHFAAWEQPQLFSSEIRDAFRPLRKSI
jgi:hypothetical protein